MPRFLFEDIPIDTRGDTEPKSPTASAEPWNNTGRRSWVGVPAVPRTDVSGVRRHTSGTSSSAPYECDGGPTPVVGAMPFFGVEFQREEMKRRMTETPMVTEYVSWPSSYDAFNIETECESRSQEMHWQPLSHTIPKSVWSEPPRGRARGDESDEINMTDVAPDSAPAATGRCEELLTDGIANLTIALPATGRRHVRLRNIRKKLASIGTLRGHLTHSAGARETPGVGSRLAKSRSCPLRVQTMPASKRTSVVAASSMTVSQSSSSWAPFQGEQLRTNIQEWRKSLEEYRRRIQQNAAEISQRNQLADDITRTQIEQQLSKLAAFQAESLEALIPRRLSRQKLLPGEREAATALIASCRQNDRAVVVDAFNLTITKDNLSCLRQGEWLNDEVVNFYLTLLYERSKRERENIEEEIELPKCYFWNTFFYPSLTGEVGSTDGVYDYAKVCRWTKKRKIDLFNFDYVFVPIHVSKMHWTLGVINFREKRLEYYDSMGSNNAQFFQTMLRYLQDEHMDKKGTEYPVNDWKTMSVVEGVPQQENGWDCGVFTCQFAECLSDGRKFDFAQANIPDLRLKMALQIKQCRV